MRAPAGRHVITERARAANGSTRGPQQTRVVGFDEAALARLPAEARGEIANAEQLANALTSTSANTLRMYRSRILLFVAWCSARGLRAMPAHPEVLRLYLIWLGANQHAWSTIKVSHAAIVATHRAVGYGNPTTFAVRATLRALRRALGSLVVCEKAIGAETMRRIVATCTADAAETGTRDRALLLLTYFGNLMAGESTTLDREDVERTTDGYVLRVTMKLIGDRRIVEMVELRRQADIEMCPVRALDAWLRQRADYARKPHLSAMQGALFVALRGGHGYPVMMMSRLSTDTVRRVLLRRASTAGIAPGSVSLHSVRAQTPTGEGAEAIR